MATTLDPKQIVSFKELLMSQVVEQEALTRLLIKKGVFRWLYNLLKNPS